MPKFPFSLFDFRYIDKFGPMHFLVEAASGIAIPETMLYKVPDYKFTLILSACVNVTKTTATSMQLYILHLTRHGADSAEYLINEDAGTGVLAQSWPSSKATTDAGLGWCLKFLFPGDTINVAQALTAVETIRLEAILDLIEYSDPRYAEK